MITVRDFMTENPVTVTAETPMIDVIQKLIGCKHQYLPVLQDGRLVGLISERDLKFALSSLYQYPNPPADVWAEKPAAQFMIPHPLTVSPEDTVYLVAELLSIYNVGALPVLENDNVVGIVTITGLLKFLASKNSLTGIELLD
ncbi:MAG: hypothetical protein Kow0080_05390 [Candidatus Promineifilaceae bacterium]